MKKQFAEPTLEILHLEISDILTSSSTENLLDWEIQDNPLIEIP